MLKDGLQVRKKKGLTYVVENENSLKHFKPWLGDSVSCLYDIFMKHLVFPQKLGSDMNKHNEILCQSLQDIRGKRVLELATGSGSAVDFLPHDNPYTGTDISPGLLRKATRRFRSAGFKNAEFYVVSSDRLPFDDHLFDMVLCILAMNFFCDVRKVLQEIKRVVVPGAVFMCSVPVPERNKRKNKIRGALHSEAEWENICHACGFSYASLPFYNGALLYFKAICE